MKCGKLINGKHIVGDAEVKEFFDQLGENAPLGYAKFREHCEERERWGRDEFEYAYLGRPLGEMGQEEAADGGIYCVLDSYAMYRTEFDADVAALLMEAARKFAEAHAMLRQAQTKRKGTP